MTVNLNYTGPTTSVVVGKEATYGTDPASYTALGVYQAEVTASMNTNVERVYALGARAAQAIVGKQVNVTGTIRGAFQDARLLAFALGCDNENPSKTHWLNYKTSAATPITIAAPTAFTMIVTRGTSNTTYALVETYTGCRIDRLTITGSLDAPLQISADFIAQNFSSALTTNAQTATFSADEVQPPQNVSMKVPNSTALSQVQNWELTVNNNLNPVFALGSQLLRVMPARQLEIGLTGTVAFTDEALWAIKEVTNDSSSPYTFDGLTSPKANETIKLIADNGLATTSQRQLNINLTSAAFGEISAAARAEDLTMLDFTATVADFDQTGWGATPTGAPIEFIDNTAGTYVGATGGV